MPYFSAAQEDCAAAYESAHLPAELNGFRIAGEYSPAFDVGGDFYAFAPVGSSGLSLVIGDVCGRGAAAAELVSRIRPHVSCVSHANTEPARLLAELNATACVMLPDTRFVTAAAVYLDRARGTMTIANAGHVPAIVRSPNGTARIVGAPSGPPLGMIANGDYTEETTTIERGDVIVLMTDGVLEAIEHDLITMPTLLDVLTSGPCDADAMNRSLLAEVRRRVRRPDDMTLLSVAYCDDGNDFGWAEERTGTYRLDRRRTSTGNN
jgi:serine phosphatase RsbU (regulator of sigma subunit)